MKQLDVLCIQETHFDDDAMDAIRELFKGFIVLASNVNGSQAGVCFIIQKNFAEKYNISENYMRISSIWNNEMIKFTKICSYWFLENLICVSSIWSMKIIK